MKKYVIIVASILIFSLFLYEINAEEDAIRNIKFEINGVEITEATFEYAIIKIHVKFINNGSRDVKNMKGSFKIYILNASFGDAYLKDINVGSHSSYNASIPLKIYYKGLAHGIINAIREGKIEVSIKGKIEGKIFFGLINYSQNIQVQ